MNGNTDQLLGKLIARTDRMAEDVHEIKSALENHANRIEARVASLELRNAETTGGTRMLLMLSGGAATIGGIVAHFVGKVWPS